LINCFFGFIGFGEVYKDLGKLSEETEEAGID
jgi:hypothetical protein